MSWDYRAFSKDEHVQRVDRGRALMANAGLAACVCTSPELIYYFTGYDAHTHHVMGSQALILPLEADEPILIIRDGDAPQAEETVTFGRIRTFRFGAVGLAQLIADTLLELGAGDGTVGMDLSGPTTTGAVALALHEATGHTGIRDCWRLLGQLRTVLSETETLYLREAAAYADAGIDAFLSSARVGMSEIELAAEIEHAVRAAGSDYPAVPTWMASGDRQHCQHGMASPRRLAPGDLIHAEFAGVARRYHCVTMASVVLGEPTERMQQLGHAATVAFEAGVGAARLGGRIGDMEQAYHEALVELGIGECGLMRFGTGLSAAYPPVWENQITIQRECNDLLDEGMAFYVHASLQSMADQTGMLLGGSYLMGATGPERLDHAPIELVALQPSPAGV